MTQSLVGSIQACAGSQHYFWQSWIDGRLLSVTGRPIPDAATCCCGRWTWVEWVRKQPANYPTCVPAKGDDGDAAMKLCARCHTELHLNANGNCMVCGRRPGKAEKTLPLIGTLEHLAYFGGGA